VAAIIINHTIKNHMEDQEKRANRRGAQINLKPAAGNSPSAQEKSSIPNRTATLPSGAVAEFLPFKGKHLRIAQRMSGSDQSLVMYAIIATVTLIDGKGIVMEDLDEMDGRDVLKLIEEYEGLF